MKFTVLISIILFSLTTIAAPTVFKEGAISLQAISIGDSAAADTKALLDIKSTTKGVLFPRMTSTQMNAISSPTTGLMVWNTTAGNLYQYNGSSWIPAGTLSPLTTKGDIYVYGTGNDRLPVGTNNYTIIADSAQTLGVKWGQLSLTAGVTGTLPVANGGTGQTTANAALNALAPTQTGNSGKFLTTDGTNTSWAAASLTTQGQNEGSGVSTLTLKVPNNQLTTTNTNERLVETGNGNMLKNPSFEASTAQTDWTAAGTKANENTIRRTEAGKQALKVTVSGTVGGMVEQALSLTGDVTGNYEGSIWVKTSATATTLQFCIIDTDSSSRKLCTDIAKDGAWHQYTLNYPGFSTIGIAVYGNTVNGSLYFDDGYLGPARNIGTVQQAQYIGGVTISGCASAWTSTSSSYSDFSTVASCVYTADGAVTGPATNIPGMIIPSLGPGRLLLKYIGNLGKQTGTTNDSFFVFYDGTTTTQEATIGNATSQWDIVGTYEGGITYTTAQSNLSVRLRGRNNGASQTVQVFQGRIEAYYFPSQAQTVVTPTQYEFNETDCPTITGSWSTNTTYTCKWYRRSNRAYFDIKVAVSGAPTAANLTVNLPSGIAFDTSKMTTYNDNTYPLGIVSVVDSGVQAYSGFVKINTGNIVIPFVQNASGTIANDTAISSTSPFTFGSGDYVTLKFDFPVSGWVPNPMPVTTGSVLSGSTGGDRIERATVGCGASSSIQRQSGSWLSSITNISSGTCDITIASGMFSGLPSCTASQNGVDVGVIVANELQVNSATSLTYVCRALTSGSSTVNNCSNVSAHIICMGPR